MNNKKVRITVNMKIHDEMKSEYDPSDDGHNRTVNRRQIKQIYF